MTELRDRLGWAEIRRLALGHRRELLLANALAVLATLCSVPIPLLLPVTKAHFPDKSIRLCFLRREWLPPG